MVALSCSLLYVYDGDGGLVILFELCLWWWWWCCHAVCHGGKSSWLKMVSLSYSLIYVRDGDGALIMRFVILFNICLWWWWRPCHTVWIMFVIVMVALSYEDDTKMMVLSWVCYRSFSLSWSVTHWEFWCTVGMSCQMSYLHIWMSCRDVMSGCNVGCPRGCHGGCHIRMSRRMSWRDVMEDVMTGFRGGCAYHTVFRRW